MVTSPVVGEASRAPAGREGWRAARADRLPSRVTAASRRRNVPYLLVGVLLVLVCAGGAVVAGQVLGGRVSVLALARPVAAGHLLTAGDVRAVEISAGSGMDLVPAGSVPTVLGRPVAFSLPAGSLLTAAELGPVQIARTGEAVAAVGVKPGQFPPDVEPGTRVAVLVSAGTGDASTGGGPATGTSWTGVVVGVTASGGDQTTVVSVRMSEADARAVAAAPAGRLTVVLLGGGG
jgi:hypothetical protein